MMVNKILLYIPLIIGCSNALGNPLLSLLSLDAQLKAVTNQSRPHSFTTDKEVSAGRMIVRILSIIRDTKEVDYLKDKDFVDRASLAKFLIDAQGSKEMPAVRIIDGTTEEIRTLSIEDLDEAGASFKRFNPDEQQELRDLNRTITQLWNKIKPPKREDD